MTAGQAVVRADIFELPPDPRFVYTNTLRQSVYSRLLAGIRERKGLIVLIGEQGLGKTTLLSKVMDECDERNRIAYRRTEADLTLEFLLQAMCRDLGIAEQRNSHEAQVRALMEFLTLRQELGGTTILLLDDAQELSDDVLEGVYKLTLIEKQGEKLLQVILSGRPELETRLQAPRAHPIGRAVSDFCHLSRLERRQVSRYIKHRVRNGGYDGPELFKPEAVELIAELSNGVPRAINRLCGESLELASRDEGLPVDRDSVERAQALLESGHDPNRVDGSAAQDLMFARNGAVPDWLRESQTIDINEEEDQSDSSADALQTINLATLEAAITEAAAMERQDKDAPPPEADPGALADSLDSEAKEERQRPRDPLSQGTRPLRTSPFRDWSIPIPDDDIEPDGGEDRETPGRRRPADIAVTPSPDGLSIPASAAMEIGNARRWAKRARLVAGFAIGIVFGAGVVAFFQWDRVTPIDEFPDWLKMAARESDPTDATAPAESEPSHVTKGSERSLPETSDEPDLASDGAEENPAETAATNTTTVAVDPLVDGDVEAPTDASAQFIEDLVDPKSLAPVTGASQADRLLVSDGTIKAASLETPIPPAPKVELPEPPAGLGKPQVRELPPTLAAELEAARRGEPQRSEDSVGGSKPGSDFLTESTTAKSLALDSSSKTEPSNTSIDPPETDSTVAEFETAPPEAPQQSSQPAEPGPVDLAAQALKDTAEAVKAAVAALAPAANKGPVDPEEAAGRTAGETDQQTKVATTAAAPDTGTPLGTEAEEPAASKADQKTVVKSQDDPQVSRADSSEDLATVPTLVDSSRRTPGAERTLTEKPPAMGMIVDNPFADNQAEGDLPATAEVTTARERASRRALSTAQKSADGKTASQEDLAASDLASGLTRRRPILASKNVSPIDENLRQSVANQGSNSPQEAVSAQEAAEELRRSSMPQTAATTAFDRDKSSSADLAQTADREKFVAKSDGVSPQDIQGSAGQMDANGDLVPADILTGDERIVDDRSTVLEPAAPAGDEIAETVPLAPVAENLGPNSPHKALADEESLPTSNLAVATGDAASLPPPLPVPPSPPAALALLLPKTSVDTQEPEADEKAQVVPSDWPYPSMGQPRKAPAAEDSEAASVLASAQGKGDSQDGSLLPTSKGLETQSPRETGEGTTGSGDTSSESSEMTAASRAEEPTQTSFEDPDASLGPPALATAAPTVQREPGEPSGTEEEVVQAAASSELTSTTEVSPKPQSEGSGVSLTQPASSAIETTDPKVLLKDTEGKLTPAEDMPVPATLGANDDRQALPPEVEELPALALEKSDLTAREPALAAVDSHQFGNDVDADPAIHRLLMRGQNLVRQGDMASARLFFQLAAKKGSARAATATAMTYDPVYHQRLGIVGAPADAIKAIQWYEKAIERGDSLAYTRLEELDSWLKIGPPETEKE